MKTYVYLYERGRNSINGNPRHLVTVYRIKNNTPHLLDSHVPVGYVGELDMVCNIIGRVEGWGQKHIHHPNGYSANGVRMAYRENKIQIIQLVGA